MNLPELFGGVNPTLLCVVGELPPGTFSPNENGGSGELALGTFCDNENCLLGGSGGLSVYFCFVWSEVTGLEG